MGDPTEEWKSAKPISPVESEWNQAAPVITEPDTPEWAGKYPNIYGLLGAAKAVLGAGA